MKKTKIIGTIGPASNNYQTLKKLVLAGLNVVRINLSHATREDMENIFNIVNKIREELNCSLPIMIDTRGPEIRVKTFKDGSVKLTRGQIFTFTGRDVEGTNEIVSFNIPEIVECIKPNQKILAVNGLITFKVLEVNGLDVKCKVLIPCVIRNKKSLAIPGVKFTTPYLNDKDISDIEWGIKHGAEIIAASFVNCKEDVLELRALINKHNGKQMIVSKIESAFGIKNLDEIIEYSDGIMVARGDLGVELPISKLPELQKAMIKKTRLKGKIVIIATEMLESMIYNNRPTRAEASDVANAVYDGTSVVMLSGESAAGKYPVEAVKQMAKICEETEKHIDYKKRFLQNDDPRLNNVTDVISHSAVNASFLQKTKVIVVFTNSGESARMVSRFRPSDLIIGATPNKDVYQQLALSWGVLPVLTPVYNSTDEMFEIANKLVKDMHLAKPGDIITITCGTPKKPGKTNLIKLSTVR